MVALGWGVTLAQGLVGLTPGSALVPWQEMSGLRFQAGLKKMSHIVDCDFYDISFELASAEPRETSSYGPW